jgi:hypothetical protein
LPIAAGVAVNRTADEVLNAALGSGAELVYGIVTQASPLLVRVGTATTATPAVPLREYSPRTGDYVAVLQQGRDRLVIGAVGGSGWTDWTPSYTGITIGNGSSVGRYKVLDGDTCMAEFQFIFGSTSGIGATNTVVLPVEAIPLNEPFESGLYLPMGEMTIRDANVTNYDGTLTYQSTTGALMRYRANSPVRKEILSSTAPIAVWAVGDSIRGKLIYECAP